MEIPMKIHQLSLSERILLAEELWDSVVLEQEALEITDAQRQELERRLDAYSIDNEPGEPWDVVKERLS